MHLKSIKLEQYRNYKKMDLEFDPKKNINIFVGYNAQGKTNFLEAITLLSLAKSFRTSTYTSLINWDSDYSRVIGKVMRDSIELVLEFFISKEPIKKKNVRKNGVDVPVKDFIGQLNVVFFHPEDLNIFYLSPGLRRKYINTILSQTDPLYFESLVSYNRTMKQRNKSLQLIEAKKAKKEELNVWDEKLAEYGFYILKKRLELVEFFNSILNDKYNNISNTNEDLKMKYESTLGRSSKKEYLNKLYEQREHDIRYQQTQKGIHRDDVLFFINERNVHEFASRGEMRTLIIALKLAEIAFIEKQTKQKPILLLDDVFSELDKKRQQFLINAITEFQSFITTTHHDFSVEGSSVFEIANGMLN